MKCPRCGLFNQETAEYCDCGHHFASDVRGSANTVLVSAPALGRSRSLLLILAGTALAVAGGLVAFVTVTTGVERSLWGTWSILEGDPASRLVFRWNRTARLFLGGESFDATCEYVGQRVVIAWVPRRSQNPQGEAVDRVPIFKGAYPVPPSSQDPHSAAPRTLELQVLLNGSELTLTDQFRNPHRLRRTHEGTWLEHAGWFDRFLTSTR